MKIYIGCFVGGYIGDGTMQGTCTSGYVCHGNGECRPRGQSNKYREIFWTWFWLPFWNKHYLFLYLWQFLCIVRIDTCITEGGYTCAFPFEWGGKTYNKCTMDGGYSKPWCYQREGSWGYCESGSCLGDNKIMDIISGHTFYKIYPILHLNLTEELFLLCNYIRMYLQRSFIVWRSWKLLERWSQPFRWKCVLLCQPTNQLHWRIGKCGYARRNVLGWCMSDT